jgi:CheY-like chemotaxis protein
MALLEVYIHPAKDGFVIHGKVLKMKELPPVLYVDDDNTDTLLFRRAFEHLQIANPLIHLSSCQEALEYLMTPETAQPWIVLTDLNTPRMNGIEFLKAVKDHKSLKQTTIIVLSGSGDEEEIAECFKCGAAGYMVKPSGHEKLIEMLRTIYAYWTLSRSPQRVETVILRH